MGGHDEGHVPQGPDGPLAQMLPNPFQGGPPSPGVAQQQRGGPPLQGLAQAAGLGQGGGHGLFQEDGEVPLQAGEALFDVEGGGRGHHGPVNPPGLEGVLKGGVPGRHVDALGPGLVEPVLPRVHAGDPAPQPLQVLGMPFARAARAYDQNMLVRHLILSSPNSGIFPSARGRPASGGSAWSRPNRPTGRPGRRRESAPAGSRDRP